MLQETLQNIGFTAKEAKIYLANLELGTTKPSQIGDKTGLNRVTVYEVLKKLKDRGVVIEIIKNNVKYYSAVNPENIIGQIKNRVKAAEHALPEMLAIYNLKTKKPRVLFFEGLDGLKKIYQDSLTSKTEILTFTNSQNLYAILGDFNNYYVAQRVKNNIKLRAVALADAAGLRAKEEGTRILREVRLVPPHLYSFTNEIMIYDNKTAIVSLLEKVGVIIESADIAKTQKEIFKMAWEYAGQF
jgi:sugar-specific transcriptional regulator TrmB